VRDLALVHRCPGVETPGYSQPSLRDDELEVWRHYISPVRAALSAAMPLLSFDFLPFAI
jgi:hypothetical protein